MDTYASCAQNLLSSTISGRVKKNSEELKQFLLPLHKICEF